jgi:hypothetical protein
MGVDPYGQTAGEASLCRAVANQPIQIKEQSIMKLIFGFLLFVAAVAITGGLYLVIRKPAQKKTDLEKLESVPPDLLSYSAARRLSCQDLHHRLFQDDSQLAQGTIQRV